jgi:dihydroorotate dehydrogenase electron transfer subunit
VKSLPVVKNREAATAPSRNVDGTIDAVVTIPTQAAGANRLISLLLPVGIETAHLAGRFFLARCGAHSVVDQPGNWQFYLRRPLFAVSVRNYPDRVQVDVTSSPHTQDDPGFEWLTMREAGERVNLIGPLGNGFRLPTHSRSLLLVADLARMALLLPLVDEMLDRGGKVVLLVQMQSGGDADQIKPLIDRLPLAAEVQRAAPGAEWQAALAQLIPWADHVCIALPQTETTALVAQMRRLRFRLNEGFGQLLVETDLACGWGSCLACIVPLGNGSHTRACVHGPVMDAIVL